ncbi:hypothetical protein H6CHR_03206 [Variovorax sp. PBL-H6]|uniref:hypothetical protein n=1 Tax=Variovorax sp. PBL-H6 TaxID=434009 RepID=UPI001319AE71|nr:hypothetical protein [Variovorax sp. PBL-H6]VTU29493.1 hypothetical protein H6CHR_03206 [Variovorax sp. PBL-H6]
MNEQIPHLNIETLPNGNIRVENESMGDSYVVDLHPMHLRFIAEHLGLVREMSASHADALRTVDKLGRRLRVLSERVEQLTAWIWEDSEDINQAVLWHSDATRDLAREFLRELSESGAVVTPCHAESRVTPAPVPRDTTGTKPIGNPEETQRVPNGCPTTVEHPLSRASSQMELRA